MGNVFTPEITIRDKYRQKTSLGICFQRSENYALSENTQINFSFFTAARSEILLSFLGFVCGKCNEKIYYKINLSAENNLYVHQLFHDLISHESDMKELCDAVHYATAPQSVDLAFPLMLHIVSQEVLSERHKEAWSGLLQLLRNGVNFTLGYTDIRGLIATKGLQLQVTEFLIQAIWYGHDVQPVLHDITHLPSPLSTVAKLQAKVGCNRMRSDYHLLRKSRIQAFSLYKMAMLSADSIREECLCGIQRFRQKTLQSREKNNYYYQTDEALLETIMVFFPVVTQLAAEPHISLEETKTIDQFFYTALGDLDDFVTVSESNDATQKRLWLYFEKNLQLLAKTDRLSIVISLLQLGLPFRTVASLQVCADHSSSAAILFSLIQAFNGKEKIYPLLRKEQHLEWTSVYIPSAIKYAEWVSPRAVFSLQKKANNKTPLPCLLCSTPLVVGFSDMNYHQPTQTLLEFGELFEYHCANCDVYSIRLVGSCMGFLTKYEGLLTMVQA